MEHPVYCEQPLFQHFFEPLNTLTNLFFVLAGIILIFQLKKAKALTLPAIWLSSLLIIIGIGSLLWHLYRSDFTLLIDLIPIALFIFSYLVAYVLKVTHQVLFRILLIAGFFIYAPLITILVNRLSLDFLGNGGAPYLVSISYLAVIQLFNLWKKVPVIRQSLVIVIVFFLSLLFRQLDMVLCDQIHFGTHFIWHILNAVTLYLMIRLLYIRSPAYYSNTSLSV